MKKTTFKLLIFSLTILMGSITAYGQFPAIQYYRYNDLRGLNVFETSKDDTTKFDGIKLRIGGDFAMQFQGISQSNFEGRLDGEGNSLDFIDLSNNMTLPTANMNFDVQLEEGVRMHLRVYLSSRHHAEGYVKGGYLQIDQLNFIKQGFLEDFMSMATIRIGMDEINYGDLHLRRSDNARAIFNPFVGNYIMDSFTTEPFMEVTLQKNGLLGVVGISNGRLNQSPEPGDDGRVIFGKLGYDKQINDDLRFRLVGSLYSSSKGGTRDYIYGGDRAGGRYYNVLHTETSATDFEPRFNPGFGYLNSFMVNPFVKYKGLEFFGLYENINNGDDEIGGSYTHLGAELLYRFGNSERLYIGGRYNNMRGASFDGAATQEISRTNIGAGWFMTKNVLTKLEYVASSYDGDGWTGTKFQGAEFDGVVIEAAISF